MDPLDRESITKAIARALTEPETWQEWSQAGLEGARAHYCWDHHAKRYLRDLDDILKHTPTPTLAQSPRLRRLPDFDRLLITDLDNTLTGDADALAEFVDVIRENDHVGFGIATGRRLDSALELIEELGLPRPDLLDTDVGTQLHYGEALTADRSWRNQIGYAWKPDEIRALLDKLPGLYLQDEGHQSEFKISYELDASLAPKLSQIKKKIREAGLRAKVVLSLEMYLDIIPVRGGSDLSMRHLLWKWGFPAEHVLVAGDSGNDAGMLVGRTLGVVVGNYSHELERLRNHPRIYFAKAHHAAGVLEGVEYYNFLDNIVIPNDRI